MLEILNCFPWEFFIIWFTSHEQFSSEIRRQYDVFIWRQMDVILVRLWPTRQKLVRKWPISDEFWHIWSESDKKRRLFLTSNGRHFSSGFDQLVRNWSENDQFLTNSSEIGQKMTNFWRVLTYLVRFWQEKTSFSDVK